MSTTNKPGSVSKHPGSVSNHPGSVSKHPGSVSNHPTASGGGNTTDVIGVGAVTADVIATNSVGDVVQVGV